MPNKQDINQEFIHAAVLEVLAEVSRRADSANPNMLRRTCREMYTGPFGRKVEEALLGSYLMAADMIGQKKQ